MRFIALLAVLTAYAVPALAQQEAALEYYARETRDQSDNDVLRFSYGQTFDRGWMVGGAIGFRNEYWAGPYKSHVQAELGRIVPTQFGRLGWYGRLTWADRYDTGLDAGIAADMARGAVLWRGLAALQLADDDILGGERKVGFAALGEASWYLSDDFALRGGVMLQEIDPLVVVGFEYRRSGVSFYGDWSISPGGYRDYGGYNDLAFGFRWTPSGDSLMNSDRTRPRRLFYRPIDVY